AWTGGGARRVVAVIADAREIEHPGGMGSVERLPAVDRGGDVVFSQIGRGVVPLRRTVSERRLQGSSPFEDGLGFELRAVPLRRTEQFEQLGIPSHGIAAVRLGLDVVPEDRFLSLAAGPGALASDRAGLALDALVSIEDVRDLPRRLGRVVRILHRSPDVPVGALRHETSTNSPARKARSVADS